MNTEGATRLPWLMALAMLALAIAPFLALAPFSHPSADDYCYANKMRALGFGATQAFWYSEWSGRFTANALMSLGPWSFTSLSGYQIVGPALIILLFLALFWLAREVVQPHASLRSTALIALAIEAVFLATMASPAEGVYWYTGVAIFSVGAIFAVMTVAAGLRAQAMPTGSAWPWSAAAGLFAVMAGGSNEVVMLMLGLVLLVITVAAHRFQLGRWRAWLVPLTITAIAGAIDIAAPGNYKRVATTQGLSNFLGPLLGSAMFAGASVLEWLSSGSVLVGGIAIVICGMAASSRLPESSAWRKTPWFVPVVVTVCGVWGAFLFTHWASGFTFAPGSPGRVINVVFLFFLLTSGISAFMIGVQLAGRNAGLTAALRPIGPWLLPTAAMLALGSANIREAYIDLVVGRAGSYDRELDSRYAVWQAASGSPDTVAVPTLTRKPKTLFFADLTEDPGDWRNICYAEYWKVRAVTLQPQP